MDDDRAQDGEKSTRERASEIANAQKNVKRAQKTAKAAQKGAQVATQTGRAGAQVATQAAVAVAEAAAATVEIWGPILLIIIAVVLLVMVFTAIISILSPPPSGGIIASCPGTCEEDSCTPPGVEDTNGDASCPRGMVINVCCVTPTTVSCADVSGTCTTATGCVSPNTPDPVLKCDDPANPVCCTKPGTKTSIHFYCQYDSRYRPPATNNSIDKSCDIRTYGCAPTSIAMVASSFGLDANPLTIAEANGYMGCFTGTTFNQSRAAVSNTFSTSQFSVVRGLISPSGAFNTSLADRLTSQGYIIIAEGCMTFKGHEPYGGHSIVIGGMNADGTLQVYDPTYCSSNTDYTIRKLDPSLGGADMRSGGYCGTGSGWYDAVAVKLL